MKSAIHVERAEGSERVVRMQERAEAKDRRRATTLLALAGFGAATATAALAWSFTLERRVEASQAQLAAAQQQTERLNHDLNATNARLSIASATLGQSVGMTQHELEVRADELLQAEKDEALRLEQAQVRQRAEARRQIGAVSGQVKTMTTDVVAVKTDVAQTKNELQTMKGDMGVQSGHIATNARELAMLRRKGDRSYFEFTLVKGEGPTPLAGVSVSLKKADVKHSRYTLVVQSDDKKIEKKDRNLNEPVQFYTGRDNALYELVVNSIDKNQITGYLATPKGVGRGGAP